MSDVAAFNCMFVDVCKEIKRLGDHSNMISITSFTLWEVERYDLPIMSIFLSLNLALIN